MASDYRYERYPIYGDALRKSYLHNKTVDWCEEELFEKTR